ncbi:MAG: type II toxin-antitoxin system RelE/ParE family toxin [Alphaproteobacteria bacterium]
MSEFRVSRQARDDIREIGRYTQALWGRVQRRIYLSNMEMLFRNLAGNPEIAPERHEFDPPVRLCRYGNHLIVYRSENDPNSDRQGPARADGYFSDSWWLSAPWKI